MMHMIDDGAADTYLTAALRRSNTASTKTWKVRYTQWVANIDKAPPSSLSPREAWLFTVGFTIIGLVMLGVASGVIPTSPGTIHAPRWVLGVVGVMFVIGGLAPLAISRGPSSVISKIVGPGIVLPLTIVANWIAFGPGERHFSGGFSADYFAVSQKVSETGGRIVFGIGAVVLDLFELWILLRMIRAAKR